MLLLLSLIILILLNKFYSITFNWNSDTAIYRACNFGGVDFSYFGVSSYSNNGFLITPLSENSFSTGKINVYLLDTGIKIKKEMLCKYWTMTNLPKNIKVKVNGILFCDLENESKVYPGIQLINDISSEIRFSGNFDSSIQKCNSIPFQENNNIVETNKPTEIKNNVQTNIINNNINNEDTNKIENKYEEKEDNKQEDNKQENNDQENNIDNQRNNDNNKPEIKNEKTESKPKNNQSKNIFGISEPAAIAVSACCGAAAVGLGVGYGIYTKKISKNNYKKIEQKPTKRLGGYYVTLGIITMVIGGFVIHVPKLKWIKYTGYLDSGPDLVFQSTNSIIDNTDEIFENINKGMDFDIDRAIEHLNSHAHEKSTNSCAKYVMDAVEAGGLNVLRGHAYLLYENHLMERMGFKEIPMSTPFEKGDIIVCERVLPKHENGHVEMYNGETWVSDFKQKTPNPYIDFPDSPKHLYRYYK